VTQLSHPHLVHRANLPSQALAVAFQAVAPHPSQAHALLSVLHALALHLVLHLAAAHFQVPAVRFHPHALLSALHVPVLHLAIRPLAQAAPVLRFQAHLVVLLLLAALHPALHPLAQALHPVIQPSLLLVPLAPHPLAVHLHLRVRASRYYKASISILIALRVDGLLRWSVLALRRMPAWTMA